jgi:hypothetical protein
MTAYTKSTNFATKDTLTSGDPLKIVKGTEINTEFDNIQTAVNSKSNTASPTFTGTVTIPTLALSGLTASSAVATNASNALVSVTNTGTGNNVLATSPTLVTPILGTPQSGSLVNCTDTNYTGFKNRIINGAMVIDQRNAGASVTQTTAILYTVDRWASYGSVASKFTIQRNAGSITPPAGYTNYLGITSSSAYTVGATEFFGIQQVIEGYNIADVGFGTASAQTVTLSFWVRSSLTGTFGGTLSNDATNRVYPFTYTISSANTWTQIIVTIAGDTSGTWQTTTSGGIVVWFSMGAGASVSGTAGAWSGSTLRAPTGATSVVGTNGATFYITGVQLEKGSTATTFDYRPYGTELALCQRYFTSFVGSVAYSQYGIAEATSATKIRFPMQCPVPMRAAPTFSTAGSGFVWALDRAGSVVSSLTLNYATTQIQSISGTGSSLTIGQAGSINAGNFTDTSMSFSAEL